MKYIASLPSNFTPSWIPFQGGWRLAFADRLGFFALALIALCGLPFSELQRPAMVMLLIAFMLAAWDLRHALLRSPIFWLIALWTLYATTRIVWAGMEHGWHALDPHIAPTDHLRASALVALLAGLWLRDDPTRFRWLLGLALIGVILWLTLHADWTTLGQLESPGRWVFGDNPNRVALVMMITMLGLLSVGIGWPLTAGSLSPFSRFLLASAAVLGAGMAIWIILVTGSRQTLVATAAVLPALTFLLWKQIKSDCRWTRRHNQIAFLAIAFVLLTSSVLAFNVTDRMGQRIAGAFDTVHESWGAFDGTGTDGSTASRLLTYTTAFDVISERPFFGWGPVDPKPWIEPSHRSHWHNLYLQTAFGFGLVGVVLFFGGFAYIAWLYRGAAKRAGLNPYAIIFTITSAVAIALILLLTVRINQSLGRYLITFVFGLMAAPILAPWFHDYRTAAHSDSHPNGPAQRQPIGRHYR